MAAKKTNDLVVRILLLAVLLVVGFVIIKPFINALLAAVILAYIFYPLYKRSLKYIKHPSLNAFVITILALLIITVPLVFIFNSATGEAHFLYMRARQRLAMDNLAGVQCAADDPSITCKFTNWFNEFTSSDEIQSRIKELLSNTITWFADKASALVLALPGAILNFIIILFTMFYLLQTGPKLFDRLFKLVPVKQTHHKRIKKQLSDIMYATVYGAVIVSIIQGILGSIGFWFFGLSSPILWGIIMAILAIIPVIGTWLVWIPAGLGLLLDGFIGGESGFVMKGILLLLYGAFIIQSVDYFAKPKIIGARAKVHPVIIMIGALGGLFVFGPIGFIIGPVILALVKVAFEIYEHETLYHKA